MSDLMTEILDLERLILELPQVEMPVAHFQINGVYARALFIPQGVVLTGKIHNSESISILAKGTLRVCNGENYSEISEGHIAVEKAGIKRIGYALTDCVFVTVHRTDKTEIADIEEELTSMTFEEFEQKTKLLEIKE